MHSMLSGSDPLFTKQGLEGPSRFEFGTPLNALPARVRPLLPMCVMRRTHHRSGKGASISQNNSVSSAFTFVGEEQSLRGNAVLAFSIVILRPFHSPKRESHNVAGGAE
uniref:Uncharacterized protein n=1 Tax=Odontella aurita TaxID=265563 RepID=A0A7S4JST3_9STRA